ncbi:YggS family pyridoxal phosphate enzyme [Collinsella intestinalis]|uniref:YggS family pyridoxal phosphate enzyme n=1 Tax=Collinsella intestinalis TaxID=147207 RepID=UPI00195D09C9|nr:YggS family pyridoxal phosphate enzyme [Collinsella intestinalis]MBM6682411.1 YggS family pyridoxal phosphate enzyme [Collinsella intestinalis]
MTTCFDIQAYREELRRRRDEILTRFDAALARSGRPRGSAQLMAVSKTVGVDEVLAAIEVGYRLFGENRPQELNRKLEGLSAAGVPVNGLTASSEGAPATPDALTGETDAEQASVRLDMIGNLQKNKINSVLGRAALIHSVSSLHLARAISERAARRIAEGGLAAPQDVLLEVNVSGEASKSGFAPEELRAAIDELQGLDGIRIRGLMTMAPRGDNRIARQTFAGLRELRDELAAAHPALDLAELSCGMSEDFEAALEEGSTLVRLGRVVFNPAFELE